MHPALMHSAKFGEKQAHSPQLNLCEPCPLYGQAIDNAVTDSGPIRKSADELNRAHRLRGEGICLDQFMHCCAKHFRRDSFPETELRTR